MSFLEDREVHPSYVMKKLLPLLGCPARFFFHFGAWNYSPQSSINSPSVDDAQVYSLMGKGTTLVA